MAHRLLATLGSLVLLTTAAAGAPAPARAVPPPPPTAPTFGPQVYRLADLAPGTDPSVGSSQGAATASRFVFTVDTRATGVELGLTDGTRGGTRLLEIRPGGLSGVEGRQMTSFRGLVWFAANDGVHGTELWVSDGTVAGTRMFADLFTGATGSTPINITTAGGRLWFAATDESGGSPDGTGNELWVSDGSVAGTRLVADPHPTGSSAPQFFTAFGSRVVYTASIPAGGRELWITDGTVSGTAPLADVNPGASSSFPTDLVVTGSRLVFAAQTPDGGTELFGADGTPGGTQRLRDILPGTAGSFPAEMEALPDGTVVFAAGDGTAGRELWATDGTTGGTQLPYDLASGPTAGSPSSFVRLGDAVSFRGPGNSLWRTRGTVASTDQVVGGAGPGPDLHSLFSVVAGRLVFMGVDATGEEQVYASDGTVAGTRVVSDFADLRSTQPIGVVGNTAIIGAYEPAASNEPHAFTAASTSTSGHPRARYSATADARRTVRVTVRVSTSGGVRAAGRVTIVRGRATLGTAGVAGGVATVRLTRRLGPGLHTLRARFAGGVTGRASTSPPFRVRISPPRRR